MKKLEVIPFVTKPIGWMPCVACSDFKTRPGRMWLGYTKGGDDLTITCPVCKGAGQVERFQHVDVRTGQPIDPERPGQIFVKAETLPSGHVVLTDATVAAA